MVGGDGLPISPTGGFPITSDPPMEYRFPPDVGYLGGLTYLVTWYYFDPNTSDEGDIYAQFIQASTTTFLGPTIGVDTSPNFQAKPSMACSTAGTCLLAYENNLVGYPGGDTDIRKRMVFLWRNYLPVVQK